MSPGKATAYTGPNSNPMFPDNYLTNKKFGFNYVDAVWNYYAQPGKWVSINAIELSGNNGFWPKVKDYTFVGSVVGDQFIFKNSFNDVVSIGKPFSNAFFAGAQSTFDAWNNTIKAIIVRQLTSAFDAGLLPAC